VVFALLAPLLFFLQAANTPPEDPHRAALEAYRQHQYPKAAELFEKAVAIEKPDSSEYRESVLLLAQSYYLQNKPAQALPWLERAVQLRLNTLEVSYMLGNTYIQTRQPDKAVEAFALMFGYKPDSAAAHLVAAQFMIRQEFEEDAVKEIHKALELNPNLPQAHYLLGELAIFRSNIDEAVEHLTREIALNPDFAMAYYKLGDAYTRREQWDQAIPQLQRAIWLNPNYSGPYILLGKAYFKRGELANAEGMLRRAIAIDPNNQSAHYILGQTLMQAGKTEEARKMLQRSRELQR
jgi:tetratricopeptide (TPR) repeat protein